MNTSIFTPKQKELLEAANLVKPTIRGTKAAITKELKRLNLILDDMSQCERYYLGEPVILQQGIVQNEVTDLQIIQKKVNDFEFYENRHAEKGQKLRAELIEKGLFSDFIKYYCMVNAIGHGGDTFKHLETAAMTDFTDFVFDAYTYIKKEAPKVAETKSTPKASTKSLVIAFVLFFASFASFASNNDELANKTKSAAIEVKTKEAANLESLTALARTEHVEEIAQIIEQHYGVKFTSDYGNKSSETFKASKDGKRYTLRIVEAANMAKITVIANK